MNTPADACSLFTSSTGKLTECDASNPYPNEAVDEGTNPDPEPTSTAGGSTGGFDLNASDLDLVALAKAVSIAETNCYQNQTVTVPYNLSDYGWGCDAVVASQFGLTADSSSGVRGITTNTYTFRFGGNTSSGYSDGDIPPLTGCAQFYDSRSTGNQGNQKYCNGVFLQNL